MVMIKKLSKVLTLVVIVFLVYSTIGCNNIQEFKEKYFADYSLVKAKELKSLSQEEVAADFKDRTYFVVKFPDSSYR